MLNSDSNDKWPRDAPTPGAVAPEMEARMHIEIYGATAEVG